MKTTIRTKKLDDESVHLFEEVMVYFNDLTEKYVDEIIICDANELEKNIKEINHDVTLTSIYGSLVLGKTMSHNGRTIIFLITEIATNLICDLFIKSKNEIIFGDSGIRVLKTLFHEFGHAKNIHEYGELVIKKEADSYYDSVNEHWKILRDEYLAEMFCANIYRFKSSISWYGAFSDTIEENNFRTYTKEYALSPDGLSWHLAFQLLNQYYFIPLFQKAGFLEGVRRFIETDNIAICESITKILNYQVVENVNVHHDFNSLILKKWEEFQIVELLKKVE